MSRRQRRQAPEWEQRGLSRSARITAMVLGLLIILALVLSLVLPFADGSNGG